VDREVIESRAKTSSAAGENQMETESKHRAVKAKFHRTMQSAHLAKSSAFRRCMSKALDNDSLDDLANCEEQMSECHAAMADYYDGDGGELAAALETDDLEKLFKQPRQLQACVFPIRRSKCPKRKPSRRLTPARCSANNSARSMCHASRAEGQRSL